MLFLSVLYLYYIRENFEEVADYTDVGDVDIQEHLH